LPRMRVYILFPLPYAEDLAINTNICLSEDTLLHFYAN